MLDQQAALCQALVYTQSVLHGRAQSAVLLWTSFPKHSMFQPHNIAVSTMRAPLWQDSGLTL